MYREGKIRKSNITVGDDPGQKTASDAPPAIKKK